MSPAERSYRRLYRSGGRVICAVCGGVAEYLGMDPVRLITAAVTNLPVAALVCLVACFIVPEGEVAEEGTAGTAEVLRKHPTGAPS